MYIGIMVYFLLQFVCFLYVIFPHGLYRAAWVTSCPAFFTLHYNMSILYKNNLMRGSFCFVYSLSTYRLKKTKSTAAPLILQNIIQRYGISILDTSHKNGTGEIQNMCSGKLTHLVKYMKGLTYRYLSPDVTSMRSGPPFLGSDLRATSYMLGDLENILNSVPFHFPIWVKPRSSPMGLF